MQPFIDSDKYVYGTISQVDQNAVTVDWDDKPTETFKHEKCEYKDFTKV